MTDQRGYEARQSEWLRNTGVSVGDKMLVCDSLGNGNEWGTDTIWISEMDVTVGQSLTVADIDEYGVRLATHDNVWWFPFFVLVKVGGGE